MATPPPPREVERVVDAGCFEPAPSAASEDVLQKAAQAGVTPPGSAQLDHAVLCEVGFRGLPSAFPEPACIFVHALGGGGDMPIAGPSSCRVRA